MSESNYSELEAWERDREVVGVSMEGKPVTRAELESLRKPTPPVEKVVAAGHDGRPLSERDIKLGKLPRFFGPQGSAKAANDFALKFPDEYKEYRALAAEAGYFDFPKKHRR